VPVSGPQYPVNLVLEGKSVLVVGGGAVARGKVQGLVDAGAAVHVVAPEIDAGIRALPVTCEVRRYEPGEAAGYRLVIAATDDRAVNEAVFLDADGAGVWVNSADDPQHCTFTLPARIRQGRLLVTFSTGGHSPAVASWLRKRFAAELGPEYGTLVDLLAEARDQVLADGRGTEDLDWQSALDSGMLDLIRQGHLAEAKERLQACLSSSSD
jgi:siroheme synthase-like protein